MPKPKIYSCCICHKILEDYKPHRLVHQEYEKWYYKNTFNYDFCDDCFKIFKRWIYKHRGGIDFNNGGKK